jgi:ribosomal protein S18 acetylase RimI-like enzyme
VERVEVRLVRPEEYEAAGRIVVTAYEALPGAHLTGDYAAELSDVARRAREAEVLVAVTPETIGAEQGDAPVLSERGLVGCVTLVPDASSPWAEYLAEGEAGIRMLAVLPRAQGRGVGRVLVDACIRRARASSRHALMLHTTPWMTTAQHLYASSGFVRFPERDWTPVPEVPLLAYRLDLA